MSDIVVVGSLAMDFIAVAPRLPSLGETVFGDEFLMVPGGKGSNQALAAARLGARDGDDRLRRNRRVGR